MCLAARFTFSYKDLCRHSYPLISLPQSGIYVDVQHIWEYLANALANDSIEEVVNWKALV